MAIVRWAPFDLADEPFGDLVRRTYGDFGSSLLAGTSATPVGTAALDAFVEGDQLHVRARAAAGSTRRRTSTSRSRTAVLHVRGERKQRVDGRGQRLVPP